jgi:hypothetical protein
MKEAKKRVTKQDSLSGDNKKIGQKPGAKL